MNLALAYWSGDREQAVKLMQWIAELGGLGNHKLYTIAAHECEPIDILPSVRIPDAEKIKGGVWSRSELARSAQAPNSMFRTFAWYFYLNKLGPWLFIEPDAVPLKEGWIDILEQEYNLGKKPFMGAHVQIAKVPEHLSGCALYPQNVPELGSSLLIPAFWEVNGQTYELAFDIAGGRETLQHAHITDRVQHIFRHPPFQSLDEFRNEVTSECVLFHSDKAWSLAPLLRASTQTLDTLEKELITKYPVRTEQLTAEKVDQVWKELNKSLESDGNVLRKTYEGDSREAITRDTVAILAKLCTAPRYTGAVRKELRAQGVIK